MQIFLWLIDLQTKKLTLVLELLSENAVRILEEDGIVSDKNISDTARYRVWPAERKSSVELKLRNILGG